MTEKLKKPLFDLLTLFYARIKQSKRMRSLSFLNAVLCVPLVIFFLFATFVNQQFFPYLILGLLLIVIYLIPLRNRLARKDSLTQLHVQDMQERMNLVEAMIARETKAVESFRQKIINFSQLKGLTERLAMCLTLDDTSKSLAEEVNALLGDRDSTIILYLFQSRTGELGISSSHKGEMRVNIKSKKGDIFDQWIVKTMQPLLIENTKNDYRFDIDQIKIEENRVIRSLMSVPLVVGSKALGILRIDSPKEDHFDTEDLRFLTTVGGLGSVAIENAQLYERVEQLAIKDSLTGLYLRRYLLERMPEEVSRHLRSKQPLSFLMIDLDKFKEYNDKFGHMAGDIVLRTVGRILSEFFNEPGSLVCRYGGEEFSVLLPECSKNKAVELAKEVGRKVAEKSIVLRREKTHMTISIGVATFPKDAQIKEELINKADQALYQAKREGRNKVCAA